MDLFTTELFYLNINGIFLADLRCLFGKKRIERLNIIHVVIQISFHCSYTWCIWSDFLQPAYHFQSGFCWSLLFVTVMAFKWSPRMLKIYWTGRITRNKMLKSLSCLQESSSRILRKLSKGWMFLVNQSLDNYVCTRYFPLTRLNACVKQTTKIIFLDH